MIAEENKTYMKEEEKKCPSLLRGFVFFPFFFFTEVSLLLVIVHIWLSAGEFLLVAAYITEIPLANGRTAVLR